jgi:hypothetical protein
VLFRSDRSILIGMPKAIFRVIDQAGGHFSVEMTPPGGKPRVIPDFRNRQEADAWIVQTERLLHARDPMDKIEGRATSAPSHHDGK